MFVYKQDQQYERTRERERDETLKNQFHFNKKKHNQFDVPATTKQYPTRQKKGFHFKNG